MDMWRRKLSSPDVLTRLSCALPLFLSVFLLAATAGYALLPEGSFRKNNPLQDMMATDNPALLGLQIFTYNLTSVIVIVAASLFAKKKQSHTHYYSVGYLVVLILMCLDGVVLGTWSFSSATTLAPHFTERITGVFAIFHRAALWEILGQIFIACAVAHIAIVQTNDKETRVRNVSKIRLSKSECGVLVCGLVLMFSGAFIEGYAIL
ncbi:stage II sporulation protein M [Candidatus Saccharibacteria bacterium]|nr:MAG: stage II sporulation protein M [Candidatus Saccharibacteria bacterium]